MSNSTGALSSMTSAQPDPVVAALETFVSAPDLFDTMAAYLANPNTPKAVRRLIAGIIDSADRLAGSWAVAR